MTTQTLPRRQFLRTTALGAAALAAWRGSAAESPATPARLKLGIMGCGWYGLVVARDAFKAGGVEVIAISDADTEHLAKSAAELEKLQGSRPRTCKLHTDLLDTPGLQAVIIASPPQWHALQSLAALERGVDVYCEKPLCYDVREGRAMVDAAQRSGRIVQIGFQRRQAAGFTQAREYLRAGNAGRIVQVEAQIHYTAGLKDATPQPPPASLDWDFWCGPAPLIPYSPQVGHMNWRLEQTTGHGHLVDWGIHLIDTARWMLGESSPRTVSASGGLYQLAGKITTPDVLTVHFEFASCPLTWRHRIWGAEEYTPEVSNGLFFYGDKETVFATDNRWVVIPRGKSKERRVMEARGDAGAAHVAEFLESVRTRKPPACPIEEGHRSTTAVKLAMIAYDTGRKITWDAGKEEIVGDAEATKLLRRPYREPWQHPAKA